MLNEEPDFDLDCVYAEIDCEINWYFILIGNLWDVSDHLYELDWNYSVKCNLRDDLGSKNGTSYIEPEL